MEDYDFIIRIIQFLDYRWGIRFFISTRDFDILYRWWERKIPMGVIKDAISAVVADWRKKGKRISGFSNFSYRVKRKHQAFMQLHVGEDRPEEADDYHRIEHFFNHYPPALVTLRRDFEEVYRGLRKGEDIDLAPVYRKMVALYQSDRELNLKTEFFMKGIARNLRTPEMAFTYRLNYLIHKFNIPDFDLAGE